MVEKALENRKPYPLKSAGTFQAAASLLYADDHRVRSDQVLDPGLTESCFLHPRCDIDALTAHQTLAGIPGASEPLAVSGFS
jgi:hypothetical protein